MPLLVIRLQRTAINNDRILRNPLTPNPRPIGRGNQLFYAVGGNNHTKRNSFAFVSRECTTPTSVVEFRPVYRVHLYRPVKNGNAPRRRIERDHRLSTIVAVP